MKILYVPVFRAAISYVVTLGRRWSILDHMLLIELTTTRRSVSQLSLSANMPERVIVESLINLLRTGWIEVRTATEHALFTATAAGKLRAGEPELRPELRRERKWASLCMDRLTGAWMRTDDLDLVYFSDLPEGAVTVEPILSTLNYDDPDVRDLIHLNPNEGFEGFEPAARAPSRPFARIAVSHGSVTRGLPATAPLRLREAILQNAEAVPELESDDLIPFSDEAINLSTARANILADDIVVGGQENFELMQSALEEAKTHIIIHSCFLHPETMRRLLPEFQRAARRKVRVDLLWGLRIDPEDPNACRPVTESEAILNEIPGTARTNVQMSAVSSGSHSKTILYDLPDGKWVSIVSSCNFLSSWYSSIDISVRLRSPRLASQIMGQLISAQLPASGAWSPMVRRLNNSWNLIRRIAAKSPEEGKHSLTLLADADHYACVTKARDVAQKDIVIGCDLFGIAAETSVLVPLERAAELGLTTRAFFQRATKSLKEEGWEAHRDYTQSRGIELVEIAGLHAKFLTWDDESVAVTSFNWLSTIVDGSRSRGAEIGVLMIGPGLREIISSKLLKASAGALDIRAAPGPLFRGALGT